MLRKYVCKLKSIDTQPLKTAVLALAGLGIAGVLSFHFTMTALVLQPENPLRDRVYGWVQGYMDPYFTQNWRLFAPDPEEPSKHIAVMCRFSGSGLEDSPVIDVTEPHYAALQANRLSPSQRIIRGQVYPLTLVHPVKEPRLEALAELADSPNPSDREIAATLEEERLKSQERGLTIMFRVASAECARRFPDTALSEVRLLYFHEKAPKFSQRNDPDAKGEDINLDYGWRPYEQVALY